MCKTEREEGRWSTDWLKLPYCYSFWPITSCSSKEGRWSRDWLNVFPTTSDLREGGKLSVGVLKTSPNCRCVSTQKLPKSTTMFPVPKKARWVILFQSKKDRSMSYLLLLVKLVSCSNPAATSLQNSLPTWRVVTEGANSARSVSGCCMYRVQVMCFALLGIRLLLHTDTIVGCRYFTWLPFGILIVSHK
jgi:hypothetical protein